MIRSGQKQPKRPCNCGKRRTPERDARLIARASAEIVGPIDERKDARKDERVDARGGVR